MSANTAIDAATHTITPGSRVRKLRRAIAVQGLGGLVVAVSCFLPAVKGCSSPIVPAVDVFDSIGGTSSLEDWGYASWILLPYLVGLNVAISAVRRRRPEKAHSAPKDSVTPLFLGVWIVTFAAFLVGDFENWGSPSFWTEPSIMVFGVSALIMCCYLVCGTRRREVWPLSIRWCALLLMLFWFGVWIVNSPRATYYGIWLSTAGTLAMLVCVVWEAAIRSILPWRTALWGLVRCKLALREFDQPYCGRCGYLLIGLASRRCPECGTAFESGEAFLDPNRAR